MKSIVNTGPHRLEWLDYPLPQPGAGQVRIRTGACGICATDLEMIAGWDRTGFPATPGHEWAGTVDAVGPGVDPALLGCRCVAENVWADGGEVGFEHPGGYGQYLLTEAANVQRLPADFPLATAALIEPLAVCVRALRRLGPCAGPVLVFGDGPIGLLTVALLARTGLQDIALVGGREQRLALAREFGARHVLNYHTFGADQAASIRNDVRMDFCAIVEATGSATAANAAMQLVAREGRLLVLGDYGRSRADFTWNTLLLREITLLGSNASAGAWPEAVRLAVAGQVPLHKLVTHRLPAHQFQQGVDITRSRRGDVVKVILEWA
ncbi:MAG: zinc-binding dehydrogenase [Chloroflexi bacterium]|nr:zinc-binding dehydrogenase [Chloroflexota bacterium]